LKLGKYEISENKSFLEVIEMKALRERIWLDENIGMQRKSLKEYYKDIFKEIVEEIKENNRMVKIMNSCLACNEVK
jgi:hypothetical protein